jgi:hypothetical protein
MQTSAWSQHPPVLLDNQGATTSTGEVRAQISRYGQVLASKPVGVGGITAWTVIARDGKRVTLYTTPDGQALFAGYLWDLKSGKNLSNQFAVGPGAGEASVPMKGPAPPETQLTTQQAPAVHAMHGKYTGELPLSMKTVDSLAGVKEGAGGVADTVYVIIDPRCPVCRLAYQRTRPYVKKGVSIKWIPTAALGHVDEGIPLAATILQSKDPSVLARVMGAHEQIKTTPTKATEEALARSLAFLFAAFQQNSGEAGVPVAFFLDHRTGKPRMLTGLSESVVLEDLFGKL